MYCEAAIYSFEAIIGIPLFIISSQLLRISNKDDEVYFITILCSFIAQALFLSFVERFQAQPFVFRPNL